MVEFCSCYTLWFVVEFYVIQSVTVDKSVSTRMYFYTITYVVCTTCMHCYSITIHQIYKHTRSVSQQNVVGASKQERPRALDPRINLDSFKLPESKGVSDLKARLEYSEDPARSCENLSFFFCPIRKASVVSLNCFERLLDFFSAACHQRQMCGKIHMFTTSCRIFTLTHPCFLNLQDFTYKLLG